MLFIVQEFLVTKISCLWLCIYCCYKSLNDILFYGIKCYVMHFSEITFLKSMKGDNHFNMENKSTLQMDANMTFLWPSKTSLVRSKSGLQSYMAMQSTGHTHKHLLITQTHACMHLDMQACIHAFTCLEPGIFFFLWKTNYYLCGTASQRMNCHSTIYKIYVYHEHVMSFHTTSCGSITNK